MWNREPVRSGARWSSSATRSAAQRRGFPAKLLVAGIRITYSRTFWTTDLQAIGLALDRLGPAGILCAAPRHETTASAWVARRRGPLATHWSSSGKTIPSRNCITAREPPSAARMIGRTVSVFLISARISRLLGQSGSSRSAFSSLISSSKRRRRSSHRAQAAFSCFVAGPRMWTVPV